MNFCTFFARRHTFTDPKSFRTLFLEVSEAFATPFSCPQILIRVIEAIAQVIAGTDGQVHIHHKDVFNFDSCEVSSRSCKNLTVFKLRKE